VRTVIVFFWLPVGVGDSRVFFVCVFLFLVKLECIEQLFCVVLVVVDNNVRV